MSDVQEPLSALEQGVLDYIKDTYSITLTRGGVLNLLSLGRVQRIEAGENPVGMRMSFDEQDAKAACAWADNHEARAALTAMYGAVTSEDDDEK